MFYSVPKSLLDQKVSRVTLEGFKTVDFQTARFDGEYRHAYNWCKFFFDSLDQLKVSYLFDREFRATPRPDFAYNLRQEEQTKEMYHATIHQARLADWAAIPAIAAVLLQRDVAQAMDEGPLKMQALLAFDAAFALAVIVNAVPADPDFESKLKSYHSEAIKEFERKSEKLKVDADSALVFFKSKLGPVLSTTISNIGSGMDVALLSTKLFVQ